MTIPIGTPAPPAGAPAATLSQPVGGAKKRTPLLHLAIAWLYGSFCHLSFAVGGGTMMLMMLFGMSRSLGRVPSPWFVLADFALLIQFPVLHSLLLSNKGRKLLSRLAPLGLGSPLATTTYALIASLQTFALFGLWTPSGTVWWQASGAVFWVFCGLNGVAWLLLAKSILDAGFALQTGLLGWRAVALGTKPRFPPMPVTGLFRLCRQPIYVSFALTTWTVPTWTPDQLVVAVVLSAYCLVGPLLKEARFARLFGATFTRYRAVVPYWLPTRKPMSPHALSISASPDVDQDQARTTPRA